MTIKFNKYRIRFTRVDEKGQPYHFSEVDAFSVADAVNHLSYSIDYPIHIHGIIPLILDNNGEVIIEGHLTIDGKDIR